MSRTRPDPDQLLTKIKEEEIRATRGNLKIFFGASAGVGKTYAMLLAAHQQIIQGTDVVVGIVETHGRQETETLLEGLEHLPRKDFIHRSKVIKEFDIDSALVRKPGLILVDELAHSNAPGSRHPKRWQDVEELLTSGINVYSTVNVQHLETLNDVVNGITGIRVWETVPDQVFDVADEIVLVDLPPDELLQRLKEGKIYLPHQAERAIQNFFRKGNLIALRELALRRTADRVDTQMLKYRHDQSVSNVWQTRDSMLVCLGPGEGGDRIARGAARIAARLDAPWHVLYVETPELQHLAENQRQRILKNLKLAQEMGAETATLSGSDVAEVVVTYAHDHNLAKIVVGQSQKRSWMPWYCSFADYISTRAPDLDIIQIARDATNAEKSSNHRIDDSQESWFERMKAPWQSYAMALVICGCATLVAEPLHVMFDIANIVMLFLLAVVIVSVRYGLGPSLMASVLNVVAFDFFYVPPRFSFAVSDLQYLMTFAIMLSVGLIIANLTNGLMYQVRVSSRRELRVRALYEISRDLSGVLLVEQIAEISRRFTETEFGGARSVILLADSNNRLSEPVYTARGGLSFDVGIGQWVLDHGSEAGCGTDTLPGSPVIYIPLKTKMSTRGVLVLEPRDSQSLIAPEQRRLLDIFARLIAISIERIHYINVAQTTTVQMESERLRNSLLSAISHDLRTPLAALVSLAESMLMTQPPPTEQQVEITRAMREVASRMNLLGNNMLDMARLQSGAVTLKLEWHTLDEVIGSALRVVSQSIVGHHVNINLPADLPLLEFDAVLIERVLSNLLENAIKYTTVGSIIEIGASRVVGNNIDIWVEDNGPGLPPGKEDKIFKKFERGQIEGVTPGVGLGLAICSAIIEAHAGTIRAGNRRGGGARFIFTLPCGDPPAVNTIEEDGARDSDTLQ